jgi:hypothetical protein
LFGVSLADGKSLLANAYFSQLWQFGQRQNKAGCLKLHHCFAAKPAAYR